MTFICQQCGDCCSTMGEIIEILEEISPLRFRIGYMTTIEERTVSVDPDKQDLFCNQPEPRKHSMACPFLREDIPGRVICTVHASRPDLCRQYSCFRILILDSEGRRIGKVPVNARNLVTMDHRLREVWNREIEGLPTMDESQWEGQVGQMLAGKGFRVIR